MLTSRKLANGVYRRPNRKSAPQQYYLLMCGAVSGLSIYGAVRTVLAQPWTAPPVSQGVAAAGVVLAVAWFSVLMAQTVLVQLQRSFDHRRLGAFGAMVGLASPCVAVAGAVLRAQERANLSPELYAQAEVMVVVHLLNAVIFMICLSLAVARRETSDLHRRWMVMAMLALVPEAVMGRDPTALGLLTIYGVTDSLLLVSLGRDRFRLGRVHRAYRTGVWPLILVQAMALGLYIGRWPALLAVIDSGLSGRI